jgi:hypothetical protein
MAPSSHSAKTTNAQIRVLQVLRVGHDHHVGRLATPISRETYNRSFKDSAAALRDAAVPYACMGSLALWALGGPDPNLQQDLDYAICEDDMPRAAEALRDAGFQIQLPDEDWLFKAWSREPEGPDSALVDLIYAPSGLEITSDFLADCGTRRVLAMDVPVIGATDLVVTKLHSITEQNADYSSTLQFARSLREQIDWDELRVRTEGNPFAAAFMVLVHELRLTGAV